MNFSEFIDMVKNRADIATGSEAETAICSTLQVLAERISESQALELSDQVPMEFTECLRQIPNAQEFDIYEFYNRISQREGVNADVAASHARVVIDVLKDTISKEELVDITSSLPPQYDDLFRMQSREGRA